MWPLFKLLFSANYWRLLFRADTWRSTFVAAKRAHKDKRAWKQLARTLYLLLVPVSVLVLLAGIGLAAAGGVGIAVIWGFIILMTLLSRFGFGPNRQKQPDTVQGLGINRVEPIVRITPELRNEIRNLCVLHAVLADRAGSEEFIQTKVLPEGLEVVTRRVHLDLLRERGMYDKLGSTERDLLLRADGHWPPDVISDASLMLEPVRLMRWVLRLDQFLPNIGSALSADYKIASSLIKDSSQLDRAHEFIGLTDLNKAITAAEQYFYRCLAEGVHRGLYQLADANEAESLRSYAEELHGNESGDFLLKHSIVSRASEGDVRLATTLSQRRAQVLGWVRKRMQGSAPPLEEFRAFHLSVTPATDEETA